MRCRMRAVDGPEVPGTVVDANGREQLVGRKPWTYVDKVSRPSGELARVPFGAQKGWRFRGAPITRWPHLMETWLTRSE